MRASLQDTGISWCLVFDRPGTIPFFFNILMSSIKYIAGVDFFKPATEY